jgi:hypothetical protein
VIASLDPEAGLVRHGRSDRASTGPINLIARSSTGTEPDLLRPPNGMFSSAMTSSTP